MKKICLLLSLFTTFLLARSQSDFNILSSFCQGSANNCASVALIKAAMYKYGYNQIFSYQRKDNNYNMLLRDGIKLTISQDELNSAKNYSNFDTTNSYWEL